MSSFLRLALWHAAIVVLTLGFYCVNLLRGTPHMRAAADTMIAVFFAALVAGFVSIGANGPSAIYRRLYPAFYAIATAFFGALALVFIDAGTDDLGLLCSGCVVLAGSTCIAHELAVERHLREPWTFIVVLLESATIAATVTMTASPAVVLAATTLAAVPIVAVGIIGRDRAMKPRAA